MIRKLYECNKSPTVLNGSEKKVFRKEEKNREGATPLEPAPARKWRTVSVRNEENWARALKKKDKKLAIHGVNNFHRRG